jgi:hypothetical protein
MRTSFHHQPEAQHPKSPAIETPAGRLPHLLMLWTAPPPARGRLADRVAVREFDQDTSLRSRYRTI